MKGSRSVALALVASLFAGTALAGNAGGGKMMPGGVPGSGSGSGSGSSPIAVWMIMACASGIIVTAILAGRAQNRELTQREAFSCGLAYWLNPKR